MGHGVLNESTEDEAEADPQVHVDGFDETVGVGQRRPGSHHQSGHGQHRGHPWDGTQKHSAISIYILYIFLNTVLSFSHSC